MRSSKPSPKKTLPFAREEIAALDLAQRAALRDAAGPTNPSVSQCLEDLRVLARVQPQSFHAVARFVQQLTRGERPEAQRITGEKASMLQVGRVADRRSWGNVARILHQRGA
jgi:hypothetical protein